MTTTTLREILTELGRDPAVRAEFGDDFDAKAPIKLLDQWQYGIRQTADAQVVVLSQVLAHPSNVGYEHQVVLHLYVELPEISPASRASNASPHDE